MIALVVVGVLSFCVGIGFTLCILYLDAVGRGLGR